MKQAITRDIPVVRPPSALIADPGDGKVYLEWNPNLEEELSGYRVFRNAGEGYLQVTTRPILESSFIDSGLANGATYRYVVTSVNNAGEESPPSNEVVVNPALIPAPEIKEGEMILQVPGHRPVLLEHALTVTFPNGHRIVFDALRMRLRDWVSDSGRHLVYPDVYGNPIDITELNNWGYHTPQPATRAYPAVPPLITLDYSDFTIQHHYHRGMADWKGYSVQDGRVTFHYTLPLRTGMVERHTRLKVWETWYPAEKNIGGTVYKGLYRKIELQMPGWFKDGYSVCLNEAFGINGTCQEAITYDLQWDNPYLDEIHWSRTANIIGHKGLPPIRQTVEYRPSLYALQVHPFLFINFPQGTYLLAARRYFHSITYQLSNYAAYDKDGIWPNYMVDCSVSGQRFSLETFEYLFTDENELKPPQLYMDAAMHYRRNLAALYNLNPYLTCFNYGWAFLDNWSREFQDMAVDYETIMKVNEGYRRTTPPAYQTPFDLPDTLEELRRFAAIKAEEASRLKMDLVGGAHGLWFTSPYAVDPQLLHDENHPINQAIRDYVNEFRKLGIGVAYWMRPDFIKTGTANVLSEGFIERYEIYVMMKFPPIKESLEKQGLPLLRSHPEWLKHGRDGALPNFQVEYCENWTPVSFASRYYDEVLIPTLQMMKKLGFTTIFQDGLFSVMTGVDYIDGQAKPNMPYLWRWLQDAARLGLDFSGECLLGWGNNTVPTPAEIDAANPWALIHSCFRGDLEARWVGPRLRHIAHSIYACAYMGMDSQPEQADVAKFCQEFVRQHGHPDRVYLENLRWDFLDASGRSAVKGWIWDKVYWEYGDGRRVCYPSYAEYLAINASKDKLVDGQPTGMDRSTGNILPGLA